MSRVRSVAGLFVGYNGRGLRLAERDARGMRLALASSRGVIADPRAAIALTGDVATGANLRRFLATVARLPFDGLVLTVAGHGNRLGFELRDGFFAFEELIAWLTLAQAPHIVVVLDTCGSGGLVDLVKSGGLEGIDVEQSDVSWIEALAAARPGIRVIAAVRANQNARESRTPGALNGFFTGAFLHGLRSHPGSWRSGGHLFVTDRDAMRLATGEMVRLFGNEAVPQILGDAPAIPLMLADVKTQIGSAGIAIRARGARAEIDLVAHGRRFLPLTANVSLGTDERVIAARDLPWVPRDVADDRTLVVDLAADVAADPFLRLMRRIDPRARKPLRWRAWVRDERGRLLAAARTQVVLDPFHAAPIRHYVTL